MDALTTGTTSQRYQPRMTLPSYATVEQGLANATAHLFILSARLAVDAAASDRFFMSGESLATREQALFAKLCSLCTELFQRPNCAVPWSNAEIKIVLFSKNVIDERLLRFHIMQGFAAIIGKDAAQQLVLVRLGTAATAHDVYSFLQQG